MKTVKKAARYEEGVKFIHVRCADVTTGDVSPNGGATVAYKIVDDETLEYAVAFCHENDAYNKHLGRDKSAGRLKSANHADYWRGDTDSLREHISEEMMALQSCRS